MVEETVMGSSDEEGESYNSLRVAVQYAADTVEDLELAEVLGHESYSTDSFHASPPHRKLELVATFSVSAPHLPTVCVRHADGSLTPAAHCMSAHHREWLKAIVRPVSRGTSSDLIGESSEG